MIDYRNARENEGGQPAHPPDFSRWSPPPGFGHVAPQPHKNPYRRMLRHNANVVCAGLILFFAVSPVAIEIIRVFMGLFPGFGRAVNTPVGNSILNISLNTLSLLIPALLIAHFLKMPYSAAFPLRRASARLTVPGVLCCFGTAMIGLYLAEIITTILAGTTGIVASSPDFSPPYGGVQIMLYFIAISVVPAVFEEVLCRGVVMQSLRRFGDGFALVTSSLLFAMLHRNLHQGPNAFVTGMLLGYFTLRAGSLIPAIIMHFANNFTFAFLNVIMLHMPAQNAQVLNFAVIPVFLALGVIGIILMMLLNGGFKPLHRKDVGLGQPAKYGLFFSTPMAILFIVVIAVMARRFLHF